MNKAHICHQRGLKMKVYNWISIVLNLNLPMACDGLVDKSNYHKAFALWYLLLLLHPKM